MEVSPARNDPLLEALLDAGDSASRDREIERLIVAVIQPLTERIVSRYVRAEGAVNPADAEDIVAVVNLRLVRKLRAVTESAEEAIQQLSEYVATLAYNTINDAFRRRYPERARLKSRLRYALTHDRRLALWQSDADFVAGLAEWRDRPAGDAHPIRITRTMLDSKRPADALAELFRELAAPVRFSALVDRVAALWNIEDSPAVPIDEANEPQAPFEQWETREVLGALWREIRLLPAPQRKALLFNLRDSETVNVVSLLALTGIAGLDEIAEAVEMTGDELAAIWNDLPLDDARISGLLNVTRQQVINLRKAARARLGRRIFGRKDSWKRT